MVCAARLSFFLFWASLSRRASCHHGIAPLAWLLLAVLLLLLLLLPLLSLLLSFVLLLLLQVVMVVTALPLVVATPLLLLVLVEEVAAEAAAVALATLAASARRLCTALCSALRFLRLHARTHGAAQPAHTQPANTNASRCWVTNGSRWVGVATHQPKTKPTRRREGARQQK